MADVNYPDNDVWVSDGAGGVRLAHLDHGVEVGINLRRAAVADGATVILLSGTEIDARAAANAQNGPGVIGMKLSLEGSAQVPGMNVDTGTATYPGVGSWAKAIPLVLQGTHYLNFNGAGTPNATPRFSTVIIPHIAMNSNGAVTIGRVSTLYVEAGPDINPDLTANEIFAIHVDGDDVAFDEGLHLFRDGISSRLVFGRASDDSAAQSGGSAAVISDAGQMAVRYVETDYSLERSQDGSQYRPLICPMVFFKNFDPGSASYAAGETIVKTWSPTDASAKGFRAFQLHRWTLPAAQTISGDLLSTRIRVVMSSGSSNNLQTNGTGSDVNGTREGVFIAISDAYVVRVELCVVNAGAVARTADIGNFQVEATLW